MGEFTFTVEKPCPVCGENTHVVKMKARLTTLKTDEDFCVHYKGVNPYLYKVWFCEHCGFAAEEKVFTAPMPARTKEKIAEFLKGRKLALEFAEERGTAEAVAAYKLAIFYAEMSEATLHRRAGLYLALAWVYREAEEQTKENEMLAKAAELYDKSLMTENYPQSGMSDAICMYLIGAIYYRMGDFEKSGQYLSRIIGDQNIRTNDKKTFEKARDLWQTIREEKGEGE